MNVMKEAMDVPPRPNVPTTMAVTHVPVLMVLEAMVCYVLVGNIQYLYCTVPNKIS